MRRSVAEKIAYDLAQGRKYKATLRLKNLINEFPNDLTLRNKLAEIYYDSGFYDEAGKFWLLSEERNSEIDRCIEVYKNSVNNSGHQILKDIVFRGDKTQLSFNLQTILNNLEKDSFEKTKNIPNFQPKKNYRENDDYKQTFKDKILKYSFFAFLIFILLLLILGIIKITEWF
ncbi:DUF6584 family protein [Empedobacter brevis]